MVVSIRARMVVFIGVESGQIVCHLIGMAVGNRRHVLGDGENGDGAEKAAGLGGKAGEIAAGGGAHEGIDGAEGGVCPGAEEIGIMLEAVEAIRRAGPGEIRLVGAGVCVGSDAEAGAGIGR